MNRKNLQKAVETNSHFTNSRKVSLYSNFERLQESNPDGFEANIAAWKEVLETSISGGGFPNLVVLSANKELLASYMDKENGFPLSLNCVIDRMVEEKALMPMANFKQSYPLNGARLVSKLASYAWETVFPPKFSSGKLGKLESVEYVHIPSLEKLANLIVKEMQSYANLHGNTPATKVSTPSSVRELVSGKYSQLDIDLALQYLSSSKLYFDGDIAKLRTNGAINETDKSILALKSHTKLLNQRLNKLTESSDSYEQNARKNLKTGKRDQAKLYLARKQAVDATIERTTAQIGHLEQVLLKIDSANDNNQTLEVLKSSSKLLEQLNSKNDVQDVEDLQEQLSEQIRNVDDVSSELAAMHLQNADHDAEEMELDLELEEMEREQRLKDGIKENDEFPELPSVPSKSKAKEQNMEPAI